MYLFIFIFIETKMIMFGNLDIIILLCFTEMSVRIYFGFSILRMLILGCFTNCRMSIGFLSLFISLCFFCSSSIGMILFLIAILSCLLFSILPLLSRTVTISTNSSHQQSKYLIYP